MRGLIVGSFEDFVGASPQFGGNGELKSLCGLEIEDQIPLSRKDDWEFFGLSSLEDAAGVNADLVIGVDEVGAVARQSARLDIWSQRVYRSQFVLRSKCDNESSSSCEERIRSNHESPSPIAHGDGEPILQLLVELLRALYTERNSSSGFGEFLLRLREIGSWAAGRRVETDEHGNFAT